MAILKQAREGKGVFRDAVPMQNNNTNVDQIIDATKGENQDNFGSENIIESMAEDILSGKIRVAQKKKIDGLSRTLAITVSPRIEAEWRFHASNEHRSLASWVRQAVDFYIRKHNL